MKKNVPIGEGAQVYISETWKSGDSYSHEKWKGKSGAWHFVGIGRYAGT
jgi:hypothetical protein